MLLTEMPRKDTKLRLDDRILDALRAEASESGISFNALCEAILFNYSKARGKLPIDAEPLPEARGGRRQGAGKPPKQVPQKNDETPQQESEA